MASPHRTQNMLSAWQAVMIHRMKPTNYCLLMSQYALIDSGALIRHRGCECAWIANAAGNRGADPGSESKLRIGAH